MRANFQSIITSIISILIDEIIIHFTGRSKHTIMMRGKFCLVGYNVLALYKTGYLYDFIFSSLKIEYSEVLINLIDNVISAINSSDSFIIIMVIDLKKTLRAILFLIF